MFKSLLKKIGFGNAKVDARLRGGAVQQGGVLEGDSIFGTREQRWRYTVVEPHVQATLVVACEYHNRFGDKYRVEQSFEIDVPRGIRVPKGRERLYVFQPSSSTWLESVGH